MGRDCERRVGLITVIANGNNQMYRSDTFLACVREAGLEIEQQHDGLGVSHTLLVRRNPR